MKQLVTCVSHKHYSTYDFDSVNKCSICGAYLVVTPNRDWVSVPYHVGLERFRVATKAFRCDCGSTHGDTHDDQCSSRR